MSSWGRSPLMRLVMRQRYISFGFAALLGQSSAATCAYPTLPRIANCIVTTIRKIIYRSNIIRVSQILAAGRAHQHAVAAALSAAAATATLPVASLSQAVRHRDLLFVPGEREPAQKTCHARGKGPQIQRLRQRLLLFQIQHVAFMGATISLLLWQFPLGLGLWWLCHLLLLRLMVSTARDTAGTTAALLLSGSAKHNTHIASALRMRHSTIAICRAKLV